MLAATTSPWYLPDVGQRPDAGDVADGPQPLAGAQAARRPGCHAGRARCRPSRGRDLDARAAAGGDEQAVAAQLAAVVELEDVVLSLAPRGGRPPAEDDLDAVAAQDLAERLAQGRRLSREHVCGALEQHGLAAEPAHRLRQLDPDRAAAYHEQAARDRRHGGRFAVGPDAV